MKICRSFFLLLICFFPLNPALAASVPQTDEQNLAFKTSIDKALAAAEQRVADALKALQDSDAVISEAVKIEFKQATTMLQVKQTIVQNLSHSVAMQSPIARQKFLEVLNLKDISGQDLIDLQNVINQEKAKVQP